MLVRAYTVVEDWISFRLMSEICELIPKTNQSTYPFCMHCEESVPFAGLLTTCYPGVPGSCYSVHAPWKLSFFEKKGLILAESWREMPLRSCWVSGIPFESRFICLTSGYVVWELEGIMIFVLAPSVYGCQPPLCLIIVTFLLLIKKSSCHNWPWMCKFWPNQRFLCIGILKFFRLLM